MSKSVNNDTATRKDTRFQPCNSGRPPGARNKRTILAERLMEGDLDSVVRAVIAAAKGGDMVAARLVLERLAPARKGRPVTFKLPDDVSAAGLAEAFGAVLKGVAEGEITPEEGQAVGGLLEARRRTIETVEVVERLSAIERRVSP